MVLFMLLALLVQAVTGLFASYKDVHGPLAAYVGDPLSHRITTVHSWNFYVILGLVVLHVLAVLTYAVVGGQNLLRPMITGKKRLPAATKPPRMASSLLALLVVICAALVVLMIVRL
jgi:cytochrome b